MYVADIQQMEFIHPHLRALLAWLETRLGFILRITSLYRIGDDGVHGTLPLRGADLGCHVESIARIIVDLINAHWVYDPSRLQYAVAIAHDTGKGFHIHVQVHNNTTEI